MSAFLLSPMVALLFLEGRDLVLDRIPDLRAPERDAVLKSGDGCLSFRSFQTIERGLSYSKRSLKPVPPGA